MLRAVMLRAVAALPGVLGLIPKLTTIRNGIFCHTSRHAGTTLYIINKSF